MLNTLLLLGGVLLGQTEPAAAAPHASVTTAHDALAKQVKHLVRQLDDETLAKRREAERALESLGADILSLLPKTTARTSAEVKVRLDRVREKLEKRAAAKSATASLVTLQGKMSLTAALAALEKQTGNKVSQPRNGDLKIEVDFNDTPYWEALDRILDQAGLSINAFGGQFQRLVLQARPDAAGDRFGSAQYVGLLRFEPIRIEATRSLRNPDVQGLRIALEISWEPRITPISLMQPIDKITAIDENGKQISFNSQRQTLEAGPASDTSAVELELPLALPARSVLKIASLKGELTALLPGRITSFEFDDLESGRRSEQSHAGATVFFDSFRRNQALYEVRMRLRYDAAANALESHRGWVYSNEAYMLGPDGEKIENVGFEATYQDVNEVGFVYRFVLDEGAQGCRFIYKTPAAIIRTTAAFELHDIELP